MNNQILASKIGLSLILLCLTIASCIPQPTIYSDYATLISPQKTSTTAVRTHTSTPPTFSTPIPTKERMPPTYTPEPTVHPQSDRQSDKMWELLHSQECILPCYLGIVPGKTTLDEAVGILIKLGAEPRGEFEFTEKSLTRYDYFLVTRPEDNRYLPTATSQYSTKILQIVSLDTHDTIVKRIEVNVYEHSLKKEFRDYWSSFSTREILRKFGIPDQISISFLGIERRTSSQHLLMVYQDRGFVVENYGDSPETNICPRSGKEARFLMLELVIIDTQSNVELYTMGDVSPSNQKIWRPIEELIEVNEAAFYNGVILDPTKCFRQKDY